MTLLLLLLFQNIAVLSSDGAAAMREKRYGDAVRIYRQAVAADKANPMWLQNLGIAHFYAGEYREAAVELERFVKARPEPGPAHFVRGLALLKLDRSCDAIAPLETARKWKATPDVAVELGDAYHGCKQWEKSAAAYELAGVSESKIALQAAHCWWMARRYDKALALFRQQAGLTDGRALFEFGDSLVRVEGPEAGVPVLEKAITSDPARADARGVLGRALLDLGRAADAIPHLEIASRSDSAALFALSRAYRQTGRETDAARAESEYKAKLAGPRQ